MGQRISYILLAIQLAMLRWNMTTDYKDVEGDVRLVSCVLVLTKGKGHRESHAGFFLLSELLAPQGGSSLGRATTKLLIFFSSFTFFQVGYMYPCFHTVTEPVKNNLSDSSTVSPFLRKNTLRTQELLSNLSPHMHTRTYDVA